MIKVKDLYKVIDGEVVLDHLNMQVEEGSIYGLIGPNGAGKTTLIRHLVGVLKQDAGKIFIESQPVYENIEIKRKIGYISDEMYFIETSLERNAKVYKDLYPSWNQERFEELYKTFFLNSKHLSSLIQPPPFPYYIIVLLDLQLNIFRCNYIETYLFSFHSILFNLYLALCIHTDKLYIIAKENTKKAHKY